MQRYLQNNTDICLILDFLCILHIFKILASNSPEIKNTQHFLEFFETIFENVQSSWKIDLLQLTAWVYSSNLWSIILNHHVFWKSKISWYFFLFLQTKNCYNSAKNKDIEHFLQTPIDSALKVRCYILGSNLFPGALEGWGAP